VLTAGLAVVTAVAAVTVQTVLAPAASADVAPTSTAAAIVPLPVSVTAGSGTFSLAPTARIVASTSAASPIATALAAILRPSTGYPLPTATGAAQPGDITLTIGDPGTLTGDPDQEGYQLAVTATGVTITAPTTHGLFNGVQSLRQLFPATVESPLVQSGPWAVPVVTIDDFPRYTYRGVMLDIARHYESPATAKKFIDQVSVYKVNVLHLHVADDQAFRIAINGFPNLTELGSTGSVGTQGRVSDPGGYWTQQDYKDVVAYATAHFMTVIPEVDTPGHTNAIINSEYGDTGNPLLNGHPQDINCSTNNPPKWNYTGAVGYSALCPESDNTWTILTAIITQLSAMSPGPYYNMGGDEVNVPAYSGSQYNHLVEQEAGIVNGLGKTAMGWADISSANLPAGTINQYWQTAGGTSGGASTYRVAVNKGLPIVMSPANHTYLDMAYVQTGSGASRVRAPGSPYAQTWACGSGCDIDQFYNWDPANYVQGTSTVPLTKTPNIIGVEAPVWTETLTNLDQLDYQVFPRLPATAELGWSPAATRTSTTSPAYTDFIQRLAAQGARWNYAGVKFYPTPKVPWYLYASTTTVGTTAAGEVTGAVASLSAPGLLPAALTGTIDWGDGSTSAATFTQVKPGDPIDVPQGNLPTATGLYRVGGEHTYADGSVHHGSLTVTSAGKAPVTVAFATGVAATGSQTITASVSGSPLSLAVSSNTPVLMAPATLNGQDQRVSGTLNPVTVVDPRGTNAGWSLTGQVSDFQGAPSGIIPAADLGWTPTAGVNQSPVTDLVRVGTQAPAVSAGAPVAPGSGLNLARSLCSSGQGASTGSFTCAGALSLGVPFDTPVGAYTAVLTITLI
jgi:hexosaminidase